MDIISRQSAKAAGLTHYFTGKTCKRGHIDQRWVCSFMCVSCGREKARDAYRALNAEQRSAVYLERREYLKQWTDEHREELRPKKAAFRRAHKDKKPNYFKQYYADNKERRKRESLEWYQANTEYHQQRQKAYVARQRSENTEHYLAVKRKHASKRRAIKQQVFVEVVDPRVVFDRDKGVCRICLKPIHSEKWEIDHIIPISRGGAHSYANVQLSHMRCNRKKSYKLPKGQQNLFQVAAK